MFVWVTGFYCPVSRTGSPQNEDKKKKENEKKRKKEKEEKKREEENVRICQRGLVILVRNTLRTYPDPQGAH